jgi:hypothetical protein
MNAMFPFTVRARDNGHVVTQPHCRNSFQKQKPKGKTWYAFDVTVHNRDRSCTFTVYDMEDNFHGGIGKEICKFDGILDENEYIELRDTRIIQMARVQEEAEYQAKRQERVTEIQKQLLSWVE